MYLKKKKREKKKICGAVIVDVSTSNYLPSFAKFQKRILGRSVGNELAVVWNKLALCIRRVERFCVSFADNFEYTSKWITQHSRKLCATTTHIPRLILCRISKQNKNTRTRNYAVFPRGFVNSFTAVWIYTKQNYT